MDFGLRLQGIFGGVRVEAFQPLYTFGKLDAAASAGENAVEMQDALGERVKGDMVVEATRAYFGVAFARDLAAMLEDGATQIAKGKATLVERLEKSRLGEEASTSGSVRFDVIEPPNAAFTPISP